MLSRPRYLAALQVLCVVLIAGPACTHWHTAEGFTFHWNVKGTPFYSSGIHQWQQVLQRQHQGQGTASVTTTTTTTTSSSTTVTRAPNLGHTAHHGSHPHSQTASCSALPNALSTHNCIQQPVDFRLLSQEFGRFFPGTTPGANGGPPQCSDICGPAAMFYPWTASQWLTNYRQWLDTHQAKVVSDLNTNIPSNYTGYVTIEYQNWFLEWDPIVMESDASYPQYAHMFRTMVSQVNMPVFNQTFLTMAQYTPPPGVTNFEGLSRPQEMAFLAASWRPVVQSFLNLTIATCRATRPLVKGWGFFDYPSQWPLEILQEPNTLAQVRATNDALRWVWGQVDLFLPSFFPLQFVTSDPSSSPCPDDAVSAAANEQYYAVNMVELNRVKGLYQPHAQLLPYVWWQVSQCHGGVNGQAAVYQSSPGVANMLQTSYAYKADGVVIWGDCLDISSGPPGDNATAITDQLNNVWAPYIQQLAQGCSGPVEPALPVRQK